MATTVSGSDALFANSPDSFNTIDGYSWFYVDKSEIIIGPLCLEKIELLRVNKELNNRTRVWRSKHSRTPEETTSFIKIYDLCKKLPKSPFEAWSHVCGHDDDSVQELLPSVAPLDASEKLTANDSPIAIMDYWVYIYGEIFTGPCTKESMSNQRPDNEITAGTLVTLVEGTQDPPLLPADDAIFIPLLDLLKASPLLPFDQWAKVINPVKETKPFDAAKNTAGIFTRSLINTQ